jgi:hypothetical protein
MSIGPSAMERSWVVNAGPHELKPPHRRQQIEERVGREQVVPRCEVREARVKFGAQPIRGLLVDGGG